MQTNLVHLMQDQVKNWIVLTWFIILSYVHRTIGIIFHLVAHCLMIVSVINTCEYHTLHSELNVFYHKVTVTYLTLEGFTCDPPYGVMSQYLIRPQVTSQNWPNPSPLQGCTFFRPGKYVNWHSLDLNRILATICCFMFGKWHFQVCMFVAFVAGLGKVQNNKNMQELAENFH